MAFPGPGLKIFDTKPPASEDTFRHSIPVHAEENMASAAVLYTPDLQILGSIDNTASDAETMWSRSVTTGFTFTAEVSISVSTSLEVNVEFVKAGVTVTSTLTLSSQWSREVTETMQFSVPGRKMVFFYQGFIWSDILNFDPNTQQYTWKDADARCLTNVLATRDTPIPVG